MIEGLVRLESMGVIGVFVKYSFREMMGVEVK